MRIAPYCLLLAASVARAGGLAEESEFMSQAAPAAPKPAPNTTPAKPGLATADPLAGFSDGDADGKLGTANMRKANRAAAEILQRRMEAERPDDLRLIREATGADVVVVSGQYDRMQDVLRAVQIKHVVIPPHLLAQIDMLPTQTLMINCPGHIPPEAIKKVRSFVERGGYLVTTDWALTVTQRAFPGTIEHNGARTANDVVQVRVLDDKEPLLQHVKVMKEHPRWWLEVSSFPIRIKDKEHVHVLLASSEMKEKYGESPIAVAFNVGQGKVLHMTSHLFLQQSKLVAAAEKAKGSSFAKAAGVSGAAVEEMKKKGVDLDGVAAGEINGAYSMQQMSTNLVVTKQRANKELLDKVYKSRIDSSGDVALAPSPDAPAPTTAPSVKNGYRLEVLGHRGKKTKVRDLFGREGWVPTETVK